MIRRPPRSTRTDTLFPDTTLFRSRAAANGDQGRVVGFHDGDAQISVAARARRADRPVSARVDFPAARGHDHSVLDDHPVGTAELSQAARAAERRIEKGCVITCKSRWAPVHTKTKQKT